MSKKPAKAKGNRESKDRETKTKSASVTMWGGGALIILLLVALLAWQGGVLGGTTADAPAAAADSGSAPAALPAEVSVAQAIAKRDAGAFMLDVRQPEEWTEFHMPDATLIPLGELSTRRDELPRDQEIVVVCRSGNRSASGRDILNAAGFPSVTSMAGGMNAWRSAGHPIATGE